MSNITRPVTDHEAEKRCLDEKLRVLGNRTEMLAIRRNELVKKLKHSSVHKALVFAELSKLKPDDA